MSNSGNLSVLLVEDSASDALILEEHLKSAATFPLKIARAETRKEACQHLESGDHFDVVLYDLTLPDSRGVEGLSVFLDLATSVPVVVLTGSLSEEIGDKVLAAGAQDFATKDDLDGNVVLKSIRFAIERHRLMRHQMDLQARVNQSERQQAMATLAAGLAHDIGNMLTPVVMASELGLLTTEDAQLKELFEEIRTSSRSASELARQLMAMKSPESATELRVVGFRESIDLAIGLVKRSVPPTVQLEVEIDSDSLRELKVAVGLTDLQQILINLITNSVHALGKNEPGVITISVGKDPSSGYIEIKVRDNGPGFSKSSLENAFRAFYTTKKSKGGTGLGLAMCSQILDRLGGTIAARNHEAGGAELTFRLPIAQEVFEETLDEASLSAQPGKEKILFLDDNLVIATRTKNVLELLGYQVTIFSDSEKAMEEVDWSSSPFDVVVLDYAMPGINGMSMARRIRKLDANVPLIFATAYADLLSKEELKEIGKAGLVAKPFEVRELVEKMRDEVSELDQIQP